MRRLRKRAGGPWRRQVVTPAVTKYESYLLDLALIRLRAAHLVPKDDGPASVRVKGEA